MGERGRAALEKRRNLEPVTLRGKRGSVRFVDPAAGSTSARSLVLRQRVVLVDHLAQAVGGDVGVDLGRGDVGVAQQGLDDAQIGAAFQQMGGEGVAQDVGADPGRVDAGVDRRLIQLLGETARRQMALGAGRGEQPRTVGPFFGFRARRGRPARPSPPRAPPCSAEPAAPCRPCRARSARPGRAAPPRPSAPAAPTPAGPRHRPAPPGPASAPRPRCRPCRRRPAAVDLFTATGSSAGGGPVWAHPAGARDRRPPAFAQGESIELPHRRAPPRRRRRRQAAHGQGGEPGLDRRLVRRDQPAFADPASASARSRA
jgi:hypothetical protein